MPIKPSGVEGLCREGSRAISKKELTTEDIFKTKNLMLGDFGVPLQRP